MFSQWRLLPPASPLRATALSAVRKAVELNPELLPELLDRALAVTVDREDLQALVPATSVDHLHLATLLDKKGLRLQADENYQKALSLASPGEKPIYHRLYASALIRAKRFPEALSELESTVGLDPGNPDIYLAMAEVLSSMGENSGALVNFHTALLAGQAIRQWRGCRCPKHRLGTPTGFHLTADFSLSSSRASLGNLIPRRPYRSLSLQLCFGPLLHQAGSIFPGHSHLGGIGKREPSRRRSPFPSRSSPGWRRRLASRLRCLQKGD